MKEKELERLNNLKKEERERETQAIKNELADLKSMFGEFMKQFQNKSYLH